MTAEIAIFNNSAIALAADSAVTIGEGRKIYNTALKLFTLSKFHPVGIMIYANAEFMRVPWETIIKEYRKKIAKKSFKTLGDYGSDFLKFLQDRNNSLFNEENINKYFAEHIDSISKESIDLFEERINQKLRELFAQGQPIKEENFNQFADSLLNELQLLMDEKESKFDLSVDEFIKAVPSCKERIVKLIDKRAVFPPSTASEYKNRLTNIILLNAVKGWHAESGLVIAGFGDEDTYPCYIEYTLEALYNGKLKYFEGQKKLNGHAGYSGIVPFAQRTMVDRFIEGVDPEYDEIIVNTLEKLLSKYPDMILGFIPNIVQEEKTKLSVKLKEVADKEIGIFFEGIKKYRKQKFVMPIVLNLKNLPKEELATMAEVLVNITLFKQRISLDEYETVGGPIDVAVISKGDGFIWIKRKHYFKPELNHHFFSNYYCFIEKGVHRSTKIKEKRSDNESTKGK